MRRTAITGLLVGACLAAGASSFEARTQTTETNGLLLIRTAMTVQANKPYGKGSFGSISELVSSLRLRDVNIIDSEQAQVPGFTLRLSRSQDRKHYQIALTPLSGCGTAWFGSEANVIYTGKALGCD